MKKIVGHGHFLKWVDAEFGMSADTAQRYIAVADRIGDQIPHGAAFAPSVLYALAAPSTPDEVRTEIVDRAERGEKVVAADVRELKAKLAGSSLERDEHIAERIRLTEKKLQLGQVASNEASKRKDGKGHRKPSGTRAASREIGVEHTDVRRAIKIDSITPEAKQ